MQLSGKWLHVCLTIFILLSLIQVNMPQSAGATAPELGTGETKISLNGSWNFKTDPAKVGEAQNWFNPSYDRTGWDAMKVPGNWDTENAYSEYKGIAWYARTFTVPADMQGFPVRIQFNAVAYASSVWVNGVEVVDNHKSSYAAFEANLTSNPDGTALLDGAGQPLLKYDAPNTVVVKADNTPETWDWSAWWHWGGISRDVDLVINQDARMAWQHITATLDLTNGMAAIKVDVKALNLSSSAKTLTVASKIYDKATGNLVWSSTNDSAFKASESVAANENQVLSLQTTLPANLVKLWNFDTPNLYRMDTEISEDGVLKHKLSNQFGIRKIEWTTASLVLNGQAVKLVGANRVPDDRVNGNTEPNYLVKRDLDLMKEAGLNMARIFHGQQAPNLLDYADEIGILLVEEIPMWGGSAPIGTTAGVSLAEQWAQDMVEDGYNHPSIIGWSLANEIQWCGPTLDGYIQHMFSFVQHLDETRFVTYASNGTAACSYDGSRFSDIIFINMYGDFTNQLQTIISYYPDKPIFLSEYGNSQVGEDPDKTTFDPRNILNILQTFPQIIGGSIWTLNDYRSDFADPNTAGKPKTSMASENRVWGMLNVWGEKKLSYEKLRNANSPVQSLNLTQFATQFTANSNQVTKVAVSPRAAGNIPSYTMNGYKLKWEVYDKNNQVTDGGIADIPVLNPGDAAWSTNISWKVPAAGLLKQRFTVVSPTQYEVKEQEAYFAVPNAPTIKEIIPASGQARVVFNQVNGAQSYKIKYGTTGLTNTLTATLNNFVDITGLTNGTMYQFSVIATNAKGDSLGSAIVTTTPQTAQSLLPPKLWRAVGVDGGFYVGYTGAPGTFQDEINNNRTTTYSIEYGTSSGNYTTTLTGITNYGAFKVSSLTNGATYYFRVKMDKTVNGTLSGSSNWSDEMSVIPKANTAATANPILNSAVGGDGSVSLNFSDVEKATGYRVKYGLSVGSLTSVVDVNSVASGQYTLKGLANGTTYYFAVSALNSGVESGLSNVQSATPNVRIVPADPQPPVIVIQNLLTNDFENGNAQGWTASSGSWSVVTDATYAYKQSSTAASEAVATAGDINWTNYDVQADINLKDSTYQAATGIIGRYADNNNYYLLRLHTGSNQLQLMKKVNGTFSTIASQPLTISLNTFYTLKLSMQGSAIKGYLNGVEQLSVADTSISAGKIGFRGYNQSFTVDNVKVDGIQVEVIVDNTDPEFSVNGSWTASTYDSGFYNVNYLHDGSSAADPSKYAAWTPNITEEGTYKVFMRWPAAVNRVTAAPLEIIYGGLLDTSKTVNQTVHGGEWVEIGTYLFTASATDNTVKILAAAPGYTIADAVKFVKQ
ncbi:glycoside hydrolase family 2 TIM barrel-domain containing protein [Paenibacillus oryzisoli]|uniref:golvesin C-terminal-like domain-containing protein n=1 Tax=Paenibacillus oryzisoli TaxID=1850517 RepID=UPI003D2AFAFF